MLKRGLVIIVTCLMVFPAVVLADGLTDSPRLSPKLSTTDRLIVKFRSPAASDKQSVQGAPLSSDKLKIISRKAGVPLTYVLTMSGGAHVLKLPRPMSEAETQAIVRRLQALPEIEYVEPDLTKQHMRAPSDAQYVNGPILTGPYQPPSDPDNVRNPTRTLPAVASKPCLHATDFLARPKYL
ncbi:MAG: hypothetical protein ABIN45_02965 [Gammaproteobacteria bacterium]